MCFMFQGAILYAHYGDENDLSLLCDRGINMTGRVVLVRAGKISFAEKVGGFSKKCSMNYNITVNFFLFVQMLLMATITFFPFCLQVASAAKMGAAAVLIYPDPDDYPIGDNADLYGHVSVRLEAQCWKMKPT